jgi:hypothetical protein
LWQAWPQLRGLEIELVPALLALFFGTLGYFYGMSSERAGLKPSAKRAKPFGLKELINLGQKAVQYTGI